MNRTNNYLIPALVTLVLHSSLLMMMGWGWDSTTPPKIKKQEISYVKAKIVKMQASQAKPAPSKPTQPKPVTPRADADKKKAEAEKHRKAQAEKLKKAQAEKKRKAEQEAKRKADARRKAEQEKKKAEQEQLRKKAEEKKRQEEALRKKELEEKKRQETQQELAAALAAEEAFMQARSDEAEAQSYHAIIRQAVERNWSRPASARNNMEVELVIQLIPTGQVINVSVASSSGNAAFDRSAVNAVQKAERFPELQQLNSRIFERNFRRFRLKFRPEDLRL